MSEKELEREAAQGATQAPAQDGGRCGNAAAARPMACHIGHTAPPAYGDGQVTIEIWANHVRIKRQKHIIPDRPTAKRGNIKGLSPRAARRLRWSIENTPLLLTREAVFVCLTYPSQWPKDGREVKRHLDVFGKRCRRAGICFAWALEYQTRGAPHFHLLARYPDGWNIVTIRQWTAKNWFEVVDSGDEKHLHAGTSAELVNNAEYAGWYISSYLGKEYQKTVPDGVTLPGKMWNMVGCKPNKPQVLKYPENSPVGIDIIRNIRRSAASEHAFRQRTRFLSAAERKSEAKFFRDYQPDIAHALLDFRDVQVTAEVRPENRKSWSPHDPGREKGFSVRNTAKVARQYLKTTIPPF